MHEYAKEHKINEIPCRLLIGSYFGKKIGLSTPLLKWYLNHGLVISYNFLQCRKQGKHCALKRIRSCQIQTKFRCTTRKISYSSEYFSIKNKSDNQYNKYIHYKFSEREDCLKLP